MDTKNNELFEAMKKYGKMMTSQGYSVGSAKMILETADGVFSTRDNADLANLKEDDIEKLPMERLPIFKKGMHAIVYSQTPACQKCLREARPFPAMLDDMAQVFGPAAYIVDGRSKNDTRGKSFIKALKHNAGCMVLAGFDKKGRGGGYTITMGRNLYEAVVTMTVLEKSAEIFLLADKIGGGMSIPKWEAKLMRKIYSKKYSKNEVKVKSSEVR